MAGALSATQVNVAVEPRVVLSDCGGETIPMKTVVGKNKQMNTTVVNVVCTFELHKLYHLPES